LKSQHLINQTHSFHSVVLLGAAKSRVHVKMDLNQLCGVLQDILAADNERLEAGTIALQQLTKESPTDLVQDLTLVSSCRVIEHVVIIVSGTDPVGWPCV
jgi:hypothetical protein